MLSSVLLLAPLLPWLAGCRMALAYWETLALAPGSEDSDTHRGISSVVILLPKHRPRRAAMGGGNGELIQFTVPSRDHAFGGPRR